MIFKLIVGVPSYNEADTISGVVRNIDAAFSELYPKLDVQIVNADNNSPDLTSSIFLKIPTACQKISLKTKIPGKGANLRNILLYMTEQDFDAVIFLDSDLAFVPKEWIEVLTSYLMNGYDAVFTRRTPRWNNGDLTYHLSYPVIKSMWKADIHEPISGDFAFSKKFANQALTHNWNSNILGYGVDFFFATVASKLNWCEVVLKGTKAHKLRSYKRNEAGFITMNPKFSEVLFTIRHLYLTEGPYLKSIQNVFPKKTTFGEINWQLTQAPNYDKDIEELKLSVLSKYTSDSSAFQEQFDWSNRYFNASPFIGIPQLEWVKCLHKILQSEDEFTISKQIDIFENIFLARVIHFFHEIDGVPDWYRVVENSSTM